MRLLFEHFRSDRLMLCLDPNDLDTLKDFYTDPSETKILEIKCQFDDQYLLGHAQRIGLIHKIAENTSTDRVLPSIRNQITQENEAIEQSNFSNRFLFSETASEEDKINQLMGFCKLDQSTAARIIETKWLFAD